MSGIQRLGINNGISTHVLTMDQNLGTFPSRTGRTLLYLHAPRVSQPVVELWCDEHLCQEDTTAQQYTMHKSNCAYRLQYLS